eukprot:scaffold18996_cov57-Phaeocystis_antarctica.AAC.3
MGRGRVTLPGHYGRMDRGRVTLLHVPGVVASSLGVGGHTCRESFPPRASGTSRGPSRSAVRPASRPDRTTAASLDPAAERRWRLRRLRRG